MNQIHPGPAIHVRHATRHGAAHLRGRRQAAQFQAGRGRACRHRDGGFAPGQGAGTPCGRGAVRTRAARGAPDGRRRPIVRARARRAAGRGPDAGRLAAGAGLGRADGIDHAFVRGLVAGAAAGTFLRGPSAISAAPERQRRAGGSAAGRQRGRGGALQPPAVSGPACRLHAAGVVRRLWRAGPGGAAGQARAGAGDRALARLAVVRTGLAGLVRGGRAAGLAPAGGRTRL